jgi:hypothetical protein
MHCETLKLKAFCGSKGSQIRYKEALSLIHFSPDVDGPGESPGE